MGVFGVSGPILKRGGRVFFMHNDHFFLFPLQSFSYKNTVEAVACLFFSNPQLTPYASSK